MRVWLVCSFIEGTVVVLFARLRCPQLRHFAHVSRPRYIHGQTTAIWYHTKTSLNRPMPRPVSHNKFEIVEYSLNALYCTAIMCSTFCPQPTLLMVLHVSVTFWGGTPLSVRGHMSRVCDRLCHFLAHPRKVNGPSHRPKAGRHRPNWTYVQRTVQAGQVKPLSVKHADTHSPAIVHPVLSQDLSWDQQAAQWYKTTQPTKLLGAGRPTRLTSGCTRQNAVVFFATREPHKPLVLLMAGTESTTHSVIAHKNLCFIRHHIRW